jgi:hypothetical protein
MFRGEKMLRPLDLDNLSGREIPQYSLIMTARRSACSERFGMTTSEHRRLKHVKLVFV